VGFPLVSASRPRQRFYLDHKVQVGASTRPAAIMIFNAVGRVYAAAGGAAVADWVAVLVGDGDAPPGGGAGAGGFGEAAGGDGVDRPKAGDLTGLL